MSADLTPDFDDERWYLVVLVTPDGKADGALSRTRPDNPSAWGLLTKVEAEALAEKWTADPNDPGVPGTTAQVVEVFRFEGDEEEEVLAS